jgi:hypothetical protein
MEREYVLFLQVYQVRRIIFVQEFVKICVFLYERGSVGFNKKEKNMRNDTSSGLFFLGLFVAIGLGFAGYFVGQTLYNSKVAVNTAESRGLAEKRVTADRANWTITFKVEGGRNSDVGALYKQAEAHQQLILNHLKESGFGDDEIRVGVINYNSYELRNNQQQLVDVKRQLNGSVDIETDKVAQVAKVRSSINKLLTEGVEIQNQEPRYYFTKLNDIKPEMLKEATQNARIAANEFAENAGAKVGRIQSARQGNFVIRDAGESYGDTGKIEKDVRVVTSITFYLKD